MKDDKERTYTLPLDCAIRGAIPPNTSCNYESVTHNKYSTTYMEKDDWSGAAARHLRTGNVNRGLLGVPLVNCNIINAAEFHRVLLLLVTV
jgi:hypothetical protein